MTSHGTGTQRSSFMSDTSRSMSGYGFDIEELSDEELVKQVNKLREEVRILKLENEILEKTIIRIDPALIHGVYQAYDYAIKRHSTSSMTGSYIKSSNPSKFFLDSFLCPSKMFSTASRMFTSPSRMSHRRVDSTGKVSSVIYGSGPKINLNEMMEIVATETELVMTNLNKARNRAIKKHALLRAQLEEIELRVTDIEEARLLFDEEVLIEGFDNITQRIPAEVWVRYLSDFEKKTDRQIGKLRLRTSTLNIHFHKLKTQIKVKAELSESLRPVDFDKLKIENDECLIVMDQKLQQLDELKAMTGDANLNLVIHKKTMMAQNRYLNLVLRVTKTKERQAVELEKERRLIETQTHILTQRLNKIKDMRTTYQVPEIMDYVNVKVTISDLQRTIKTLEHKIYIRNLSLLHTNVELRKLMEEM